MHAKFPLIVDNMTVLDDALALEMTVGKETWEPNTNLDDSQALAMANNKVEP